jgi:hypothetical protein
LKYVGRVALLLGLTLCAACGEDKKDDEGGAGKGASAGKGGGSAAEGGGGGLVTLDGGLVMAPDGRVFVPETDAATQPMLDASRGGSAEVPEGCAEPAPNQPPETLHCTGLYTELEGTELNDGVQEFSPGVHLWSDGGEKIDVSDPDAWKFPIGTKFWKEFKWEGKRIETRLFWKVSAFYWVRTAYKWNDDETEATRSGGEDLKIGSATYHIPSTTECDQCHKGRTERALGFETLLLGLPTATGVTLDTLKAQGRIEGTLPSKIEIGDDGTGLGTEALGWLHVNCGVSCHNPTPASEAYSTKLSLRLEIADVDGSDTSGVTAIKDTVGVQAVTGKWAADKRIVAGDPSKSLLYKLMSTRNPDNMKDQMPPIASRVVPEEGAKLIHDWISAMK